MTTDSADSPPPPATSPAERSWTGERVEIRVVGDGWTEATARSLLDSLDSHLDRIDPILVHWGATKSPQRLVIEEGKPDDSSNWETGWVYLAEGRLDALRKIAELLYTAEMARSVTYNASPVVLAAFIYLLFMWPLVRLVSRMEHRVAQ